MKYLVLVSTFSVIIPLLTGLFYFSRHKIPVKILVIYLGFTLVVEGTAYYMSQNHQANYLVYNWYMVFEYGMIASMFNYMLAGVLLKQAIWISVVLFTLAGSMYIMFVTGGQYASPLSSMETLLIILWVLTYFTQLFRANIMVNLYTEPGFWISTGLLLFFTGSFIGNGMYNYFLTHHQLGLLEKAIKSFANILMYLLFTIGIICRQWNQKLT